MLLSFLLCGAYVVHVEQVAELDEAVIGEQQRAEKLQTQVIAVPEYRCQRGL